MCVKRTCFFLLFSSAVSLSPLVYFARYNHSAGVRKYPICTRLLYRIFQLCIDGSVFVCVFACSMETCSVLAFDYKDTNISRNLYHGCIIYSPFLYLLNATTPISFQCVPSTSHHR